MSKNVVVFGASGHTGRYILRQLDGMQEMAVSAFVRTPEKLADMKLTSVKIIQGDALNAADVALALQGQDVLLAALEGDVLTMAENILQAAKISGLKRIIWMTGMGIHHEIKGARGIMLDLLAKSRPEYIKAADRIAESGIPYTLLRCPGIQDGDKTAYDLTPEGVQPKNKPVDRAAIAKCMADMLLDDSLGKNASIGITNL